MCRSSALDATPRNAAQPGPGDVSAKIKAPEVNRGDLGCERVRSPDDRTGVKLPDREHRAGGYERE